MKLLLLFISLNLLANDVCIPEKEYQDFKCGDRALKLLDKLFYSLPSSPPLDGTWADVGGGGGGGPVLPPITTLDNLVVTGSEIITTGAGGFNPFASLDVIGDIVTSRHGNTSSHDVAELGSRRIGHLSGSGGPADFTGMQLNISDKRSDGTVSANSSNIAFYTWDNSIPVSREVARITESGRLGIGTTNPTEALSVSGNTTMTGSLTINNNGTNSSKFPTTRGTDKQFLQTNGSGTLSWASAGGGISVYKPINYVTGALPISGNFTKASASTSLLIAASGSCYATSASASQIGIAIDATALGNMRSWSAVANTHYVLPSRTFIVTGVAAGAHSITASNQGNCWNNSDDAVDVTVTEY